MKMWKNGRMEGWKTFPAIGKKRSSHWKNSASIFQALESLHFPSLPFFQSSILPVFLLLAGVCFAEEAASAATVEQGGVTNRTGAALELEHVRAAIEKESWTEALRHLARVQVLHRRETEWQPAALFYEALIDARMGSGEKKVSALDELKTLYPASPWCRRAEDELNKRESEEGASE